jgi:hypothetical protein
MDYIRSNMDPESTLQKGKEIALPDGIALLDGSETNTLVGADLIPSIDHISFRLKGGDGYAPKASPGKNHPSKGDIVIIHWRWSVPLQGKLPGSLDGEKSLPILIHEQRGCLFRLFTR